MLTTLAAGGRSRRDVAHLPGRAPSTVCGTVSRFLAGGFDGLRDDRVDTGVGKVDADFRGELWVVLNSRPTDWGWGTTSRRSARKRGPKRIGSWSATRLPQEVAFTEGFLVSHVHHIEGVLMPPVSSLEKTKEQYSQKGLYVNSKSKTPPTGR
jgi:hypothetical protein